ncbi:hypothetical protein IFU23_06640 [Pantoea agglomerans]|uniref:Uncharacterized protein n=1 Tax=Enterobacter agglomerans TaxID=549 RepID=A0ACC5PVX7_ENTAG|nr:hypothetical protein [Pantoea agglomerans]MBD8129180.1 hypothetical protein [Pantoea agglomerans]MBD8153769.1 hypothetical protein [Pantoea agglomerans]MBD8157784.1 hypothetical protein [Pantoea agglomerans]MBD8231622.1 hypothetical protein [Pantoea agglomerans]MBD8241684.1 hypothetical protein [Pantoea agglomerans]
MQHIGLFAIAAAVGGLMVVLTVILVGFLCWENPVNRLGWPFCARLVLFGMLAGCLYAISMMPAIH